MLKPMNLLDQEEYTPICTEYIVTSKDCGRGVALVGWLRYNGGNYEFEFYEKAPYDIGVRNSISREVRIHTGHLVEKHLLGLFAPPIDDVCHKEFCEAFGVEYPCPNQWKLFEANWENYRKARPNQNEPLSDGLGRTLFWRELARRISNG